MLRFIASALLLLVGVSIGAAATISEKYSSDGKALIVVEGRFVQGDDKAFNNIAIRHDQATVLLTSVGGLADIGMTIGKTIAIKGFSTAVPPGQICASSCGLAWLAGRPKTLFPTSKVGFHAIYVMNEGEQNVSSDGNALVGGYLRDLGFNANAIVFLTHAQPNSMAWLTEADAARIGLDVIVVSSSEPMSDRANLETFIPIPEPRPIHQVDHVEEPTRDRLLEEVMKPRLTYSPNLGGWTMLEDSDLPGFDMPDMPVGADSPIECNLICDRKSGCVAFTFNVSHKACFLKTNATEALQYSGAVSGVKATMNVNRIGNQYSNTTGFRTNKGSEITASWYSSMSGRSLGRCQDECVEDPQCKGFNFYTGGKCVKFEVVKPATQNSTVYSGVKTN